MSRAEHVLFEVITRMVPEFLAIYDECLAEWDGVLRSYLVALEFSLFVVASLGGERHDGVQRLCPDLAVGDEDLAQRIGIALERWASDADPMVARDLLGGGFLEDEMQAHLAQLLAIAGPSMSARIRGFDPRL